jgi:hypothetical protein
LPPERSRRAACVSAGSTACSSNAEIKRAVSSSVRGAKEIVVEFRFPPPHPGWRSYNSGLAVHTTVIGTTFDQSTR